MARLGHGIKVRRRCRDVGWQGLSVGGNKGGGAGIIGGKAREWGGIEETVQG